MNILAIFTGFLLLGLASPAPTSNDNFVVDKDLFASELVKYTSKHDIINIVVPINALNFVEDTDDEDTDSESVVIATIFFVEADINNDVIDYKGLYVLKDGKAKKILKNGRAAAATSDNTKTAYFAADDGLYQYNPDKNSAVKYGTVKDNLIAIAKENSFDTLYVINDKFEMFKVTEQGTKKEKLEEVKSAKQVVLDSAENIYYYGEDKKVYVINANGVQKINGLPENPSYVQLISPPVVYDESIPLVVDNQVYTAYPNGTSELEDVELKVHLTGYGVEATLIQYYAYDKKIYEFNILSLVLSNLLGSLKEFLEDKKETIQNIASRPRSQMRP